MLSSILKPVCDSVLGHSRLQPSSLRSLFSSHALGVSCVRVRAARVPSSYSELLNPGPGGWHDKHPPNLGRREGVGEGPTA